MEFVENTAHSPVSKHKLNTFITCYNIIINTYYSGRFILIIELLSVHADVQRLLFSETSKCNKLYKNEIRSHFVSIQNYNVQSFYLMMNSSLRRGVM